eukprot:2585191-Rhodomonas_salina.2
MPLRRVYLLHVLDEGVEVGARLEVHVARVLLLPLPPRPQTVSIAAENGSAAAGNGSVPAAPRSAGSS